MPSSPAPLEQLLQRADLWRGGEESARRDGAVPTGHPRLDEHLGGGWPRGALTELLLDHRGIGELRLLLPALARLGAERWLAWIDPPLVPYAPALAAAGIDLARLLWVQPPDADERLWAAEQTLRSGACGAVLLWPGRITNPLPRRLQLAAEHGDSSGFLFRPRSTAAQHSPAALRLQLEPAADGLRVAPLKRRGGRLPAPLLLAVSA